MGSKIIYFFIENLNERIYYFNLFIKNSKFYYKDDKTLKIIFFFLKKIIWGKNLLILKDLILKLDYNLDVELKNFLNCNKVKNKFVQLLTLLQFKKFFNSTSRL